MKKKNSYTLPKCAVDLTMTKHGRLIALTPVLNRRTKQGGLIWNCLCICGRFVEVSSANLMRHHTKSCGCLRLENLQLAREARRKNKQQKRGQYDDHSGI